MLSSYHYQIIILSISYHDHIYYDQAIMPSSCRISRYAYHHHIIVIPIPQYNICKIIILSSSSYHYHVLSHRQRNYQPCRGNIEVYWPSWHIKRARCARVHIPDPRSSRGASSCLACPAGTYYSAIGMGALKSDAPTHVHLSYHQLIIISYSSLYHHHISIMSCNI